MKIRFRKILRRENLRYSASRILSNTFFKLIDSYIYSLLPRSNDIESKKKGNWETQDFQQVYWFKIIYQKSIFEIEYTSLKDVKHVITSIYY